MTIDARIIDAKNAATTWHPIHGGKKSWVCFVDGFSGSLGKDANGVGFEMLATRFLQGMYYPDDVIEFFGEFSQEGRNLRVGDRIVQKAKVFPPFPSIIIFSVAEIFVCERTADSCQIGYVTTNKHYGKGIWKATLTRTNGELEISVESTACPGSWQFWLGLPIARYLQLRARRKAIESFWKLVEERNEH